MARVTVEDCLKHVENRFKLVLLAAKRAHQIEMGTADALVSIDNDKPTVLALREIAQGLDIERIMTENDMAIRQANLVTSIENQFSNKLNSKQRIKDTDSFSDSE